MEDYTKYTKEELVELVKKLQAHNTQLKNIIQKSVSNPSEAKMIKNKKQFNFDNCKTRHVLLKFLYLGWDYNGFVAQEDTMNTIESHIFKALQKTCLIEERSKSNYHRCGRTDKGVSSFAQVISLDLRSKSDNIQDELNYCRMLNSLLPPNIQFYGWASSETDFSARFNCTSRTYKYFFPKGNLNIDAMRKGAQHLEGSHDFRNFCKMDVNNGVIEFVRRIISVEITNLDGGGTSDDDVFVLTIKGNAFLWHQIRCILAVLILIGEDKESPDVISKLLDVEKNPRKPDYQMASEIPLNLYDCTYDGIDWLYDHDNLKVVIRKLREFWTFSAVKTSMVKQMARELECKLLDKTHTDFGDFLLPGVKPKTYLPLMKRQLCDSLEQKLVRCKNRRRKKV